MGFIIRMKGKGKTDNDILSTFALTNSVHLYGGFVGTETVRTERDPMQNVTVLSGDIDGNDLNGDGNNIAETAVQLQGDNALHVVSTAAMGSGQATLDGFTITAGQADQPAVSHGTIGGGIWITGTASIKMNQVRVAGNHADLYGGGLYCQHPLQVTGATFQGNRAAHGGAVYAGCDLFLRNVALQGNEATSDGGGLLIATSTVGHLSNVVLSGNAAGGDGGAIAITASGRLTLTHASFNGNVATGNGGALHLTAGAIVTGENSILWGNGDSSGVGTASATLSNSGGSAGWQQSTVQASGGSGIGWQTALGNRSWRKP